MRPAILIAGLLFLAWFAYGGGEVVLPMLAEMDEKNHWRDYLDACQSDELRTKQYLDGYERQAGVLNLTTGKLVGESAPVITHYGPFWSEVRMIFHTLNYPTVEKPYPPATLDQIKDFLATLAPPSSSALDSYHSQFHLAFFQGGQLRIYDYRKDEARHDLAPLFSLLGFNLINDWDR